MKDQHLVIYKKIRSESTFIYYSNRHWWVNNSRIVYIWCDNSGSSFSGNMAAFDMDNPKAVVSPGGVGFDINCGVRLLRTNLMESDVSPIKVCS